MFTRLQKTLTCDNISSRDQLHESEDLGSELLVFWEKTQNSLFTNVVFALGSIDFNLDEGNNKKKYSVWLAVNEVNISFSIFFSFLSRFIPVEEEVLDTQQFAPI